MNTVIITGNLTSDPVTKVSQSGTQVCTYRIANNVGFGEKKQTNYLHIVCFGKTAENCEKYLAKGRKVMVRGQIKTGEYTNKEGRKVYTTDIYADEVEFLGGKEDSRPSQRAEEPTHESMMPPDIADKFAALDADEVPFN